MSFTILDPNDKRWASFLRRVDHDVYHLPEYARLLGEERSARACACYGVSDSSTFLLPLLLDRVPERLGLRPGILDARSPAGYPGPLFEGDPDVLRSIMAELKAFLRQEGVIACFIRTHPLVGLRAEAFESIGEIANRGKTVGVVVEGPHDKFQVPAHHGHRYDIRHAETKGYRVVFDEWHLLADFVRLYGALLERVEASDEYRFSNDYFEGLREAVGSSVHLAFALTGDGVPAAGALFTFVSGVAQYHLAAGDPAFLKDGAQKLVVDRIIRWAVERHARVVHLGGGVGAQADTLLEFKAGFSNRSWTYQTVHLVPDEDLFGKAASAWKESGGRGGETDFFPIYRAPLTSVE